MRICGIRLDGNRVVFDTWDLSQVLYFFTPASAKNRIILGDWAQGFGQANHRGPVYLRPARAYPQLSIYPSLLCARRDLPRSKFCAVYQGVLLNKDAVGGYDVDRERIKVAALNMERVAYAEWIRIAAGPFKAHRKEWGFPPRCCRRTGPPPSPRNAPDDATRFQLQALRSVGEHGQIAAGSCRGSSEGL
jgi:hypothetical protein